MESTRDLTKAHQLQQQSPDDNAHAGRVWRDGAYTIEHASIVSLGDPATIRRVHSISSPACHGLRGCLKSLHDLVSCKVKESRSEE